MEGDSASSAIDSSTSEPRVDVGGVMDQQNGNATVGGRVQQRISSSGGGADEESETDELTIDDSCVNNDNDNETADVVDDNDNNFAIVSSSTLHQMNEEEEEEDDEDGVASSECYMPEAVAVTSKPLHGDDDVDMEQMDDQGGDSNANHEVSTTTTETLVQTPAVMTSAASPVHQQKNEAEVTTNISRRDTAEEEGDVDIDGIEEPVVVNTNSAASPEHTPASPQDPSSPQAPSSPQGPESPPAESQSHCIGSPDGSSQPPKVHDSPPQSPEHITSTPDGGGQAPPPQVSPQTEAIVSQEDFSELDTSAVTLSNITSQSSIEKNTQSSQDSITVVPKSDEDVTMEDNSMDTSQMESSSQGGTQSSPIEVDNDESQQSQASIVQSEKSEKSTASANGTASPPKSRSKSRSRSNTEDGDDVDLEDGEIMDDEEEEVKAVPPPSSSSSKDKKEKEKEKSSSSSKSTKEKEKSASEREKERRKKEEEREKEKEKHRKDKKRSKREEEKEKEKEKEVSSSSSRNKKRKASDDNESEQDEAFLFVRGASPGSAENPWVPPVVEEFGDDSKVSRAKRRRESDGDVNASPIHHHHSSRPPRDASPPVVQGGGMGQGGGRGRMDSRNNKRPGREERKEPKSDVICAYFMQGKCQKSSMECSFSHDAVPPRKMELCKFWMMECCAKKEKCLYLHNDFPCKYYHTGLICKAGDRCKFSHSPLSDVTKQVLLKHIETAPKEILGDFPRLNRQGAINLINKMEARLRGEKFDDDKDFPEINQNEHHGRGPPPSHDRHHGGHNRNDDRHSSRREHHSSHSGHGGPHGGHAHGHGGPRGQNDLRGGPGGGGRGGGNDNHNNNRNSRWEQQQPTRDDQEKLQELMEEAGISGFYKDTLDTGVPPPGTQHQHQGPPPGGFPNMQPPLLPLNPVLMSQMLPGLLPPNQQNNPALANVLATLNLPNTTMVPTTLASLAQLNPVNTSAPTLPPIPTSQASKGDEGSDKSIPDHLPKMQQELFMRIQKQQQKNEKKMQNLDKSEPEEPEENWYSSEDEDESKKKVDTKAEISDKISSVLNQIRQQTQPQSASPPVLPSSLPLPPVSESKPFYGDTDFRSQPPSFKDIDLRNPSSIFKKIDIEPAKEINASLAHNGPFPWKLRKVAGVPKIDYSSIRMGLPPSSIVLDPRLGPKRNNSIPAPASPTETSAPDIGVQPLTIPDGTPVFDPRTLRGGGGSSGGGRGTGAPTITPQQNNPFLDSDNRFVRDPRGGSGGGASQPPPSSQQAQAQNLAAMAAAMAAMQQQLPNMQAPLDPNLLMFGLPFMPQQPGGGVPNPMDFQQMLAGAGNLRMRPPFSSQPPPASSSWERLNQGQQGQGGGDLTPPL